MSRGGKRTGKGQHRLFPARQEEKAEKLCFFKQVYHETV